MERKYLPILIGFIFSLLTFCAIFILTKLQIAPQSYFNDFILIIPGSMLIDILVIYAFPIAFYYIFYVIAPYLIQIYIYFHKFIYWLIRRPSQYGTATLGEKIKAGRILYRVLLVSLFSFAISVLIVQMGYGDLFRSWEFGIAPEIAPLAFTILYQAEATFFGTFFLCAIVIIIFFPVWLLEDSGVVSYRVYLDERMPIDIQGVHSLYNNVLLGYAGFSTLLILARFIFSTVSLAIEFPNFRLLVTLPILMIILPFLVIGVVAIPVYLYERSLKHNQTRLKTRLARFNFPPIKVPSFEEMKE
ncbi:MAG: hypothetical protein ACTSRS_02095 [Candidatus Helarchaeota archaeon]